MSEKERLENALKAWASGLQHLTGTRDLLVIRAVGLGISKQRIHQLTGIARTTIDRILETAPNSTVPAQDPGASPSEAPNRMTTASAPSGRRRRE